MGTGKLASEKVVVAAPMSFAGSAGRIWKLTDVDNGGLKVALAILAVLLILVAWCVVAVWYFIFGLLLVPYRLIRRGSRKRKMEGLRHREGLSAMNELQKQQQMQTGILAMQQTALMQQQQAAMLERERQAAAAVPPPQPTVALPGVESAPALPPPVA